MTGLRRSHRESSIYYEFVAVVRPPNGLTQRVAVRADDSGKGRAMLEAQYGRGCVLTLDRPRKR